jgi:uncharacterized protein (TIGR00369 family)
MDGLTYVRALDPRNSMPMAELVGFEIGKVERGAVTGSAQPAHRHINPFRVVQGGFAATALDIALGLVCISVLDDAHHTIVATSDLIVRYFRPIPPEAPRVLIRAKVVEIVDRTILADAYLYDQDGQTLAYAQCNCRIVSRQRRGPTV